MIDGDTSMSSITTFSDGNEELRESMRRIRDRSKSKIQDNDGSSSSIKPPSLSSVHRASMRKSKMQAERARSSRKSSILNSLANLDIDDEEDFVLGGSSSHLKPLKPTSASSLTLSSTSKPCKQHSTTKTKTTETTCDVPATKTKIKARTKTKPKSDAKSSSARSLTSQSEHKKVKKEASKSSSSNSLPSKSGHGEAGEEARAEVYGHKELDNTENADEDETINEDDLPPPPPTSSSSLSSVASSVPKPPPAVNSKPPHGKKPKRSSLKTPSIASRAAAAAMEEMDSTKPRRTKRISFQNDSDNVSVASAESSDTAESIRGNQNGKHTPMMKNRKSRRGSSLDKPSEEISRAGTERKRQYLRRGSVTKHKLEAEVSGMQPMDLSCHSYESDDADIEINDVATRKRYLRRGSVTKHKLEAEVNDMQGSKSPRPCKSSTSDEEDAAARRRRYLRRGSVTKHKIEAEVNDMQPAHIHGSCSDDEGDDSEDEFACNMEEEDAAARRRRYLRRGSVTKHKLDAEINDMQPTSVMENSNNKPRPALPPPPKNSSNRSMHSDYKPQMTAAERYELDNMSFNLDDSTHSRSSTRLACMSPETDSKPKAKIMIGDDELSLQDDDDGDESIAPPPVASVEPAASAEPAVPSRPSKMLSPIKRTLQIPTTGARNITKSIKNAASKTRDTSPIRNLLKARISPQRKSKFPGPLVYPNLRSCLKKESANSNDDEAKKKKRRGVRFGELVITEFPIILGDNPAVTCGAPVTIDWKAQGEIVYKISVYESVRGSRRRRRKLLISVSNRAILLLAAGYSVDEIADASISAQNIKSGRQESMQNQNWDRLNIMMETTNGALGSLMENTGKKIKAMVKPLQVSESARTA